MHVSASVHMRFGQVKAVAGLRHALGCPSFGLVRVSYGFVR